MENPANMLDLADDLELIEATLLNNISGGSVSRIGPPVECSDLS
jgi:hypothetical protein